MPSRSAAVVGLPEWETGFCAEIRENAVSKMQLVKQSWKNKEFEKRI